MKHVPILALPVLLASLALPGAAQAAGDASAPINPQTMTGAQIKAHNEKLTRNDRAYIVCRTFDQTGSQVRKTRMCRTNAEWEQIRRHARGLATDVIDAGGIAPATDGT